MTDTGPLVALLDADDSNHARCIAIAAKLPLAPMLSTWPCFTEAMYLLGALGGFRYQSVLWRLLADDKLVLYDLGTYEVERMRTLMATYHDTPMDIADASLVAVAESQDFQAIFSLDSDFISTAWLTAGFLRFLFRVPLFNRARR
ncbi:MAG: PIN domain-containing protein [Anaerolineales bacterium]|nr:PIN domain-containing protein [Anaerolineales bacterium]